MIRGTRYIEAIRFVYDYIKENGFAPSYDEIGQHMNGLSRGNVNYLVEDLVERGLVTTIKYKPRSIELTDKGVNLVEGLK